MKPSSLLIPLAAVVAASLSSAAFVSAESTSTAEYSFSTRPRNLRRKRKLTRHQKAQQKPHNHGDKDFSLVLKGEENSFWNRVLLDDTNEDMSMQTRRPTDAPRPEPAPAPTGPAPTAPAPAPTAPAPAPESACLVSVEIDCVAVDGSARCRDITAPSSGSGDGCVVEVEYSYIFANSANEQRRIYTLVISRGGDTTDITATFPVTDIQPGDNALILQNAQIDVCNGDTGFDTEAAFTVGPPSDVAVSIGCVSEEGDECRSIPQAENPDDCMLGITYTYEITNVGSVDANIVLFTRTRNGDFLDLLDGLDSSFLPTGAIASVEETEEIDRCVEQSFATNTVVAQIPNAELLCEDVGTYP